MDSNPSQNINDSHRAEIDNGRRFQSVKATASLFSKGAEFSEKPVVRSSTTIPLLTERALAKETELNLAQEELRKLKGQLNQTEETRARALSELDHAKVTIDDLTKKLNTLKESKDLAIQATEAAQNQMLQLEKVISSNHIGRDGGQDLDGTREEYAVAIIELDAAKEVLRKIRKDFDASLNAKVSALEKESEAKSLLEANKDKAAMLSEEIAVIRESVIHEKNGLEESQLEELKILSGKNQTKKAYKHELKELENETLSLKKDYDPELLINLEAQLVGKSNEVAAVQNEIVSARESDMETVNKVTKELDDAKEVLRKFAQEEISLKTLIESMNTESEAVKKEHEDMKRQDSETQFIAENLHAKLHNCKAQLEVAMTLESKSDFAHGGLVSTLKQLSVESDNARKEAEAMRNTCGELKKEADAAHTALQEVESKLTAATNDAEAAQAAEVKALGQLKAQHEKVYSWRTSNLVSGDVITISVSEYQLLSGKLEESEKLAEVKVAAALAQVDVVKASEHVAIRKLDAAKKKMKEIETAIEEALKRADMAEAAMKAVEEELRRWHEREMNNSSVSLLGKPAEPNALALSETKVKELAHAEVNKKFNKSSKSKENLLKVNKRSKSRENLLSSIRGVFVRKKSQVNNGYASYLPGEKPI